MTGRVSVLARCHPAVLPPRLPPLPSEQFLIPVNCNVCSSTCSNPGLSIITIQSFLGRPCFLPLFCEPLAKLLPLLFSSELSSLQGHSFFFSLCVISPPCRFVEDTGLGEGTPEVLSLKIISRVELQLQLHKRVSCALHDSHISTQIALNPTFGPN